MRRERKIGVNDLLNFLVSAMIACFSVFIGGAWFIGLLMEPEKSENFLILVSLGLLLGGIGSGLYCLYLATKKMFKWLYYISLALVISGYGLALYGQAIYEHA